MTVSGSPLHVLVFAPSLIPSVVIGVLRPLVELEKCGKVKLKLRYSSIKVGTAKDIAWCDVGVFCRNTEISDLEYLYELKRQDKRIIYEVDDNFEEIPLNTPIGIYHRKFFRLHALKRFCQLSDVTRVYSSRLKERAESHGANARLIRSYFDASIIEGIPDPHKGSKLKIAYPTGRVDDPRLESMFFDALRQVLVKHRSKVEIHFWRKSLPVQLEGMEGVVVNRPVGSYEEFVKSFYSHGFDIGLAPLVDEPFFHSKSNNKYREFGGCKIAGVYSDMPPYSDCVVNQKTGLLVTNSVQSWADAIEQLILNPDIRSGIAVNAHADVLANYSFDNAVKCFGSVLNEVINRPSKPCSWLYRPGFSLVCAIVDEDAASGGTVNGEQWASFNHAVNALGGRTFAAISYLELLEKVQSVGSANVVIYIVKNLEDLKNAFVSVPLMRSAIIDMSQASLDESVLWSSMATLNTSTPVSLLINSDQQYLRNKALESDIPTAVAEKHITTLVNEYSLSGYKGAYLDLLERHYMYGNIKKEAKHRIRLKNLLRWLQLKRAIYRSRMERGWALLRWRLGKRDM